MTSFLKLKVWSLFLLVLLTSCSQTVINSSRPECSQQRFPEFLDQFSSDMRTQQQAIAYPLAKLTIVDAEPEPQSKIERLENGNVRFPVMPDKYGREAEGLLLEPRDVEKYRAKALLHKPDTDYQVTYIFVRKVCWKLKEIQDRSL